MKNNKEVIDPVEQAALKNALNGYYANKANNDPKGEINRAPGSEQPVHTPIPQPVTMGGFQSEEEFQRKAQAHIQTDPELSVPYEMISLPSKGLFYPTRTSEVTVEYMTTRDEDILSTSSLIENGTVLDVLLKKKIKTAGIATDELLVGDRNAILLFLRASSYGPEYEVRVTDPRNGVQFPDKVDLTKLKPKEIAVLPDERGEYTHVLAVRKKTIKFKILNYREINHVVKTAESVQEAYGEAYSQFPSLKLKAEIVEIEGNRNKDYINQFVDAMPARDAAELKKRIQEVTPDVDMNYEFQTTDGFKFKAKITVGIDFFFPFI